VTKWTGAPLALNTTGANANLRKRGDPVGGTLLLVQSNQIDDTKTVDVEAGSFNIGANSETVAGSS